MFGDFYVTMFLPYGVIAISEGAFYNTNLDTINIPGSVTYIGKNAFYGCNNFYYAEVTPRAWLFGRLDNGNLRGEDGMNYDENIDIEKWAEYLRETYCNYIWYDSLLFGIYDFRGWVRIPISQ